MFNFLQKKGGGGFHWSQLISAPVVYRYIAGWVFEGVSHTAERRTEVNGGDHETTRHGSCSSETRVWSIINNAFLALRSTFEYGSVFWNPYLKCDIARLGTERSAAKFITRDYKYSQEGCVTKMLTELGLPSLEKETTPSEADVLVPDGEISQLMRLWYLSHRRPAKVQASLRIRAVSPETSLFAHMKYGSRRRVRPKIRHLAPLDGCACAFEEWVYGGQKLP